MVEIKIYEWCFFDREESAFHSVHSVDKAEADRMAWDFVKAYIKELKEDFPEDFDYCSATSLKEFVKDGSCYIARVYNGGVECFYHTINLKVGC